ncbi:BamA/TamA family outer membrane protein [Flammeovirga agarivorans]|uniref:BamA/TamA family outer membrane protein n=1 Tax=Flammeovirga agarivorans TaxID=2726742 RepID=A0A7X8SMT9_9BACT|nr:BamA/TamA family outer membrane protein [Flammeovirga agarivorans]NLR93118.1 BamA/TamA family outer membrane protein [Flammeovirga agarivorans]
MIRHQIQTYRTCHFRKDIFLFFILIFSFFVIDIQAQNDLLLTGLDQYAKDTVGYVRINSVNFIGNKKTKEKIITRELDIDNGSLVPKKGIKDYITSERNKVFNTQLFESVDVLVTEQGKDTLNVDFIMVERWYTWPVPLLELADRSFNEWWNNRNHDLSRIQYGLDFKQRNMRGRNETLHLLVKLGFSRQFTLGYSFPYIDKQQKTSLSFNTTFKEETTVAYKTEENKFVEYENDTEVQRRSYKGNVNFGKRYGFYDHHNLNFGFTYDVINDTIAELNPDFFLEGRTELRYFTLKYTYTRDKRDITSYPLNGYYIQAGIEKTGLGIFDDLNVVNVDWSLWRFWNMRKSNRWYYSLGFLGKLGFPEKVPYNQMRAIGYGGMIVRGYDNYVIEGQNAGVIKNELRLRALSTSLNFQNVIKSKHVKRIPIDILFKCYIDAGYAHFKDVDPSNADFTNTPLLGYGFGVDFVTFYSSVLKFEYSFNRHGRGGGLYFYYSVDL